MELLKMLSANEIVAQIACFLLLFAALRILLWKKFLGILDERKARIADEFKAAEELRSGLAGIKADYEGRIANIDEEAKTRTLEAVELGRKLADKIRIKAEEEGDKIVNNAKESVQAEVAKAKEELKNSVVDLAIEAAQEVIGERLSEEGDRKIVEEYLNRIDKA